MSKHGRLITNLNHVFQLAIESVVFVDIVAQASSPVTILFAVLYNFKVYNFRF